MRMLEERLALVDVVIEVLDARLPLMSSNPELDRIVGSRPRLVILGRDDLAEPFATRRWLAWFAAQQRPAIAIDGRIQPSVNRARAELDRFVARPRPVARDRDRHSQHGKVLADQRLSEAHRDEDREQSRRDAPAALDSRQRRSSK